MTEPADIVRLLSGSWISRQLEAFQKALLEIAIWRDVEAGTTINHAELAAAANMSRHSAGAVLRELDRLGHIELRYAQVTIRNAAALRTIVDG